MLTGCEKIFLVKLIKFFTHIHKHKLSLSILIKFQLHCVDMLDENIIKALDGLFS